jgi:hypothetical protein
MMSIEGITQRENLGQCQVRRRGGSKRIFIGWVNVESMNALYGLLNRNSPHAVKQDLQQH